MKINPTDFLNSKIKPFAQKSIKSINEIGKMASSARKTGIEKFDSFVKSHKTTSDIANTIKKTGINKHTLIGGVIAIAATVLAIKGALNLKEKIEEVRKEDK